MTQLFIPEAVPESPPDAVYKNPIYIPITELIEIEARFRRVGETAIANAIKTAIHDSTGDWLPVSRALAEKWGLV